MGKRFKDLNDTHNRRRICYHVDLKLDTKFYTIKTPCLRCAECGLIVWMVQCKECGNHQKTYSRPESFKNVCSDCRKKRKRI